MYSGTHQREEEQSRDSWMLPSTRKVVENDEPRGHLRDGGHFPPVSSRNDNIRSTRDRRYQAWREKQQLQAMTMGQLGPSDYRTRQSSSRHLNSKNSTSSTENSRGIAHNKPLQKQRCLDYYICEEAYLCNPEASFVPATPANSSNHSVEISSIHSHNFDDIVAPSRTNVEFYEINRCDRSRHAMPPLGHRQPTLIRALSHGNILASPDYSDHSIALANELPSRLGYLKRSTSSSSFERNNENNILEAIKPTSRHSDTIQTVRENQNRILAGIKHNQHQESSFSPSQPSPKSEISLAAKERIRTMKIEQCRILEQIQQQQQQQNDDRMPQHVQSQPQQHSPSLQSLFSSHHSIQNTNDNFEIPDTTIKEQQQIMSQILAQRNDVHRQFNDDYVDRDNTEHISHDHFLHDSFQFDSHSKSTSNFIQNQRVPRNIVEEQQEILNSIQERMH